MKNINNNIKVYIWIFLFLLFCVKGYMFLDPDFGWRLRTGEIILKSGIPIKDPFSYTMADFHWVDHAWLISVVMYIVYRFFGYLGLSVLFSLLAITTLFLLELLIRNFISNTRVFGKLKSLICIRFIPFFPSINIDFKKLGVIAYPTLFLVISILFTFFGVRVQVLSWLMLTILLILLFDVKKWNLRKYFLPIIFLIWGNIHGSFFSGLATLVLFITLKQFKERVIDLKDWVICALSILLTLVNPYNVGTWKEVWSSISDSSLRWSIIEWMPSLTMFDLSMVFLISISIVLFFKYRTKYRLELAGLYLIYLIQAVLSRRHLPLWAIISLPLTVIGISYLRKEASRYKEGKLKFGKVYVVFWYLASFTFILQALLALNEARYMNSQGFYPGEAIKYLKKNIPQGEIFSEYGWGGYLIWKLPEKKVFIDGRMPSWKNDKDSENSIVSAFDVFEDIRKGKVDYKDIFKKYNIDTVLWSKPKGETPMDELYRKLENYLAVFGWEKNDYNFIRNIEENGWKKIYEDQTAVIYTNKI